MYKTLLGAVLAFGVSLNASALMISSGADVGAVDVLEKIADDLPNVGGNNNGNSGGSGEKAELAWVNSVLGVNTAQSIKTDTVDYFKTSDENIFAFELGASPAYYIIKNSTNWALYSNTDNLSWAVFDASLLHAGFELGANDQGKLQISHVTEFGTGVTPVPVPASLPLLVAAIAGFGWFRRRKARSA